MRSLSDCLAFVEERHPEEVYRVPREIDPKECQHAAIEDMAAQAQRFPWLVFENALALDGRRWDGLFTSGATNTMRRLALLCGLDPRASRPFDLVLRYHAATRRPAKPEVVAPSEAPVKARILAGRSGPLERLPCWRNCEHDSRPGWFTPLWITRDPESGRYNLSWHRSQVVDGESMTIRFYPPRHNDALFRRLQGRGEPMPAVAILGHHPSLGLAGATRFGFDVDELDAAAGVYESLTGQRLRLVPSETWGDRFLVPADAEVLVEGWVDPSATVEAGPWVDAWRYYAPRVAMPVLRVAAVTMRERPTLEGIQPKMPLYDTVAYCALAYELAYRHYPGIRGINIPHLQTMVVAYDATAPGETVNLGLSFFQIGGNYAKHVILVDGSVDPYNLEEVFYALATRVDASRRVHVIPNRTSPNDPSARGPVGGGLLVDATTPVGEDFPPEGHPDAAAVEAMRGSWESLIASVPVGRKLGW